MPRPHRNRRTFFPPAALIILSSAATRPASAQILINEFLYRDSDVRLEFVEILNHSTSPIDLAGLKISDERKAPVSITSQTRLLEPGGYAVLVRDSSAFDRRFEAERIQVPSWPALNNDGDAVFLWIAAVAIDSVHFDGSWGVYGQSMERVDPDAPSANAANWQASEDPSGGTPGARNSVYEPDETPPRILDVEEWTDGTVIVYVSEPLDPSTLSLARFSFGSGDRPRSSKLSEDRMEIILEPLSGADLSALTIAGLVDASGNPAEPSTFTIARQAGPGSLVLNEILFEPRADPYDGLPDQSEFVELWSTVGFPIALRGLYLTGLPTETGRSDTLRPDYRPMRLRGHGFCVFYAAGTDATPFRDAFPSLPPDTAFVSFPVRRSSLLLGNGGDTVRLHAAAGAILDEVTYSASWHLPERSDTRGVSLERISSVVSANDPSNWSSSISPEGATPGRENSITLRPQTSGAAVVVVSPSPFSPDGDGWEDFTQIRVRSGRATSSIAVWIFDSGGRFVRSLTDAFPIGPDATLVWDGRDDADRPLPVGIFIVYVEAVDTSAGDVRRFKAPVVLARSL